MSVHTDISETGWKIRVRVSDIRALTQRVVPSPCRICDVWKACVVQHLVRDEDVELRGVQRRLDAAVVSWRIAEDVRRFHRGYLPVSVHPCPWPGTDPGETMEEVVTERRVGPHNQGREQHYEAQMAAGCHRMQRLSLIHI